MKSHQKRKKSRSRSKSKNKNKWKAKTNNQNVQQKQNQYVDPLKKLIHAFKEGEYNKEWMVSLGDSYSSRLDGKIIGENLIINGPAQSGKTSLVYWALRHDYGQTAIVVIDCAIYRTQMQFIQRLAKQLGEQLEVNGLDKRAIAQDNIKFTQLNGVIKEQGRPVVILVKNAQRLVEYKKQILLYNLFQWVATDIKKWVGLVFTTRLICFVQKFQKRVISRMNSKTIVLPRPSPEAILQMLLRRVEWLCLQQRQYVSGTQQRQQLYQKIHRALKNNNKLVEVIAKTQQYAQKDLVYFLNAIKMVFCEYQSQRQILKSSEKQLKEDIAIKLQQNLEYIFPFIPKKLFSTCTFPEYLVMAIICYMGNNNRTPYRFKTVFEVYQQFKQTWVTSQGMGSAFIYSKNILERSVLKLEQLNLIQLDNKEQSIWNCDIRCTITPEDIKSTFQEMEDLPRFFKQILKA